MLALLNFFVIKMLALLNFLIKNVPFTKFKNMWLCVQLFKVKIQEFLPPKESTSESQEMSLPH